MGRQARTAFRLSGVEWQLVIVASLALADARRRTGMLPFRVLSRQLGGITSPCTRRPMAALSASDLQTVQRVRWAIGVAAPLMPFRTLCFEQAIAARGMLARRGIGSILHLGVVGLDDPKLGAHAWLDAGGVPVTGYPIEPGTAEVGVFL